MHALDHASSADFLYLLSPETKIEKQHAMLIRQVQAPEDAEAIAPSRTGEPEGEVSWNRRIARLCNMWDPRIRFC